MLVLQLPQQELAPRKMLATLDVLSRGRMTMAIHLITAGLH